MDQSIFVIPSTVRYKSVDSGYYFIILLMRNVHRIAGMLSERVVRESGRESPQSVCSRTGQDTTIAILLQSYYETVAVMERAAGRNLVQLSSDATTFNTVMITILP